MGEKKEPGNPLVDPLKDEGLFDWGAEIPEELARKLQWRQLKHIKAGKEAVVAMVESAQRAFELFETEPSIVRRAAIIYARERLMQSSQRTTERLREVTQLGDMSEEDRKKAILVMETRWEAEDKAVDAAETQEVIVANLERVLALVRTLGNDN